MLSCPSCAAVVGPDRFGGHGDGALSAIVTTAMAAQFRRVGEPRLSPDGDWLAYLVSLQGRGDIAVAAIGSDGHVEPPTIITTDPAVTASVHRGGGVFAWTDDSESIVYVGVDRGLWRVERDGGAPTPIAGGANFAAPVVSGSRVAVIRSDDATREIGLVDVDGRSWPMKVSAGADFASDPDISGSGDIVWHEWDVPNMPWDGGRIVLRPVDGHAVVVDGGDAVSVGEPRFSPDGSMLAYLSDRSGWKNLWVAPVTDLAPRHLVDEAAEHGPPAWGTGVRSFAWSPDGTSIAFTSARDACTALRVVDIDLGHIRTISDEPAALSELTWAGERIVALRSAVDLPDRVVSYDPGVGSARVMSSPAAAAFPRLGETEHIQWAGLDGGDVYGLLTRPVGADGQGPLLVRVHGGPTGQTTRGFDPRLGFFVSRGWTVLSVNHRGSTGYGRDYMRMLRSRWGKLDVDDVAAGVRHMVRVGVADPDRVAIMGGSAGGYAVLMGMIKHCDLYAAGVALYPVTDMMRLVETTERFEAHYFDSLVGPLPEAYDDYVDLSPAAHADAIDAPLLILQGDADESVPVDQTERFVARIRLGGGAVDFHVYEGEGHGWSDERIVRDELNRIDRFLTRNVLHRASPP